MLSLNRDQSYAGRLVVSAFEISDSGRKTEFAVDSALEKASAMSVSVRAAAETAVAVSAPLDVAAAAYGSVSVIKFWIPCCVSATRVFHSVVALTPLDSPNGVLTSASVVE